MVTVSMQPQLGLIIYAGSDFLHSIQFSSFKEGPDRIVQNWPGSALDGLVRVLPKTNKAGVQKSLGLVLAEHNWPATRLAQVATGTL